MTFDEAIGHVLEAEGGYVNHPADPGGETKYGISKRAYPDEDIRNLTLADAKAIYERDYWAPSRCDLLAPRVRLIHFDCAVNCGTGTAAKLLQEAAGVPVDGVIGPVTLGAVHTNAERVRENYLWLRARYYARLARDRKASREFLPGWIMRLIKVRAL